MVYDLMEAFRPAVDLMLAEYRLEPEISTRGWCKNAGTDLRELRVKHERFNLKLMDAIDAAASSLAQSYALRNEEASWLPELAVERVTESTCAAWRVTWSETG